MKSKTIVSLITFALAGAASAITFTDVNSSEYWGKTDIPKLTQALDANFSNIETNQSVVALASNKILVGNSSGASAAVTISGDITMTTAGAVTIADSAVEDNDIALASNKILVGNSGGTATAVTVSGDITMTTAGAVTIADVAVADNDIALASNKIIIGNSGGTGEAVTVSGDITTTTAGAFTLASSLKTIVTNGAVRYLNSAALGVFGMASGFVTNGQAYTFDVPFGSGVPVVILDGGTSGLAYATSVTTTGFTAVTGNAETSGFIAIGYKD